MYAVVKTGGKQYKVAKDDVVKIEKLDAEAGKDVEFDEVLMIGDDKGTMVGAPLLEGAKVKATVLEQTRDDKIIVFRKKRRKNHRRTQGHRQYLTVVRITDILAKGKKAAAKPKAKAKAEEAPAADAPAAEE